MRLLSVALLAGALAAPIPAMAQEIDLSTIKCKEFLDSSKDEIGSIMLWLNGYYTKEDDPPIINMSKVQDQGKKMGEYCRAHPAVGIITAADKLLEKK